MLCFVLAAPFAAAGEIGPQGLDALEGADIVFLGEIHDNPLHHANQVLAVAKIRPAALVFEMLEPRHALLGTPERRGDAVELGRVFEWESRGWPDFSIYFPVFSAAPNSAVFGGAVAPEAARRAITEGGAAVFGSGARLFGLDRPLPDDEQTAREALQQEAHCDALPENLLPGMVEAQRLRDAALARAVVAAYEETGGPVAVIAGNGHARNDWGAPAMLESYGDILVIALAQLETEPTEAPPYDFWIVTAPAERPDPCETFR